MPWIRTIGVLSSVELIEPSPVATPTLNVSSAELSHSGAATAGFCRLGAVKVEIFYCPV
jgi:hypothetical protein